MKTMMKVFASGFAVVLILWGIFVVVGFDGQPVAKPIDMDPGPASQELATPIDMDPGPASHYLARPIDMDPGPA
ncbi:hypothetical protein J2S00_002115 [Caldalkalibacillus uzonensis]|uniref:Uncharacterized protein n=1 Tax=Caldalkalibacillus uzonensis TaxID=353224 RepID=A0ABU0CSC3_9BACI|nr:hypothetical protein [Caldalkalibacillus uzonensis]MDQ0339328.1 hypothetical protein [Caldalkalibacillus uzonensis]